MYIILVSARRESQKTWDQLMSLLRISCALINKTRPWLKDLIKFNKHHTKFHIFVLIIEGNSIFLNDC